MNVASGATRHNGFGGRLFDGWHSPVAGQTRLLSTRSANDGSYILNEIYYGVEWHVHVMVAWEVKPEAKAREQQITDALKTALQGYSWVRALANVYVVKVKSDAVRDELGESLKNVAKEFGGVNIIYSPAMVGGRYNGWLPSRLWPKIRERSDDV